MMTLDWGQLNAPNEYWERDVGFEAGTIDLKLRSPDYETRLLDQARLIQSVNSEGSSDALQLRERVREAVLDWAGLVEVKEGQEVAVPFSHDLLEKLCGRYNSLFKKVNRLMVDLYDRRSPTDLLGKSAPKPTDSSEETGRTKS